MGEVTKLVARNVDGGGDIVEVYLDDFHTAKEARQEIYRLLFERSNLEIKAKFVNEEMVN